MEASVSKYLEKLDDFTLERLLGTTIVRAVRGAFDTNIKSVMADLVAKKLGKSALDLRDFRLLLVDTLSEREALEFAQSLQIKHVERSNAHSKLRARYRSSFTSEKSRELVNFFSLNQEYAKSVAEETRLDCETVSSSYGEQVRISGFLHGYQKKVKDQILDTLNRPGRRVMVQMPTGAGKTFTALETAVDILRKPYQDKFVVWLVNSNELAEQALRSFTSLWKIKGDRPISVMRLFKDFEPDFEQVQSGGVVFTSYDLFFSILSGDSDARRQNLRHLINQTTYLIVDEAHAAIADTYKACINQFIDNDVTQIVGLSATPFRQSIEEGNELVRLFSGNLISIVDEDGGALGDPISYLQSSGYLARLNVQSLTSEFASDASNENTLMKALAEDGARNQEILRQLRILDNDRRKTLVFACTKDHVIALYVMCLAEGIGAEFITGDTPQIERLGILERFNSGKLNILINLEILSTGIDLPNVNTLLIARPIMSPTQYSQVVGRALRGPLNGGNEENTVINVLDNITHYSSVSLLYNEFKQQWGN
ncbi:MULTISPECIES: DEAD/DEAH box helicase [unclassified Ruegeria]|uniref:DEAD/DEAH box helicase n=1 Tax=unclassified Ruegeria TaxID=2625375 RepID=UPI001492C2C8|nr:MULTISPECIES: DEAD/DEAH box helicase [unclassified Ruegeria]NOD36656.1 DEAD/DEAH box helicase family protein [Ruegeria sp. HKCCD7296]NOE43845.1 DEAD/DEAH box helicase family protein [Ruegeria sp. HKCCD7319]